MSDPETMAVYAQSAEHYLDAIANKPEAGELADFAAFTADLPESARVLDLGCGPGQWAARLQDAGFDVDAVDASPEMATVAQDNFNVEVRVQSFDELTLAGPYDGIWANFSLLHAPRADLPEHLSRLHAAMTSGGRFHLGMKGGVGEDRDSLGRRYAYYSEQELTDMLQAAGFTIATTRTGEGAGLSGVPAPYVIVAAHA